MVGCKGPSACEYDSGQLRRTSFSLGPSQVTFSTKVLDNDGVQSYWYYLSLLAFVADPPPPRVVYLSLRPGDLLISGWLCAREVFCVSHEVELNRLGPGLTQFFVSLLAIHCIDPSWPLHGDMALCAWPRSEVGQHARQKATFVGGRAYPLEALVWATPRFGNFCATDAIISPAKAFFSHPQKRY